jgi:hypothetical protein
MGGSHVKVAPRVGTRPGGQVSVVGGAHGVAPHGPSTGGGDTTEAGGAGTAGAGGGGLGAAAGGAGGRLGAGAAAAGGAAGAGGAVTTVGGAGGVTGCSSMGIAAADAATVGPGAALRMLSVPSGPVGAPAQPATRTDTPTKNVLTRITSTSVFGIRGLVSERLSPLQRHDDAFALGGRKLH